MLTVEKTDTCWLWTAYRDRQGYGRVTVDGRCMPASRLAHQLFKGPTSPDLFVLHSCDNPPCVNPDHLSLGTPLDNQREVIERNRRFAQAGIRKRKRATTGRQLGLLSGRKPLNWFDRPDARQIFLRSTQRDGQTECWEWTGSRNDSGHGIVHVRGKPMGAHRAAFLLFKGKIPREKHVLHDCDNPPCVNPGHLHLGTHADNMREAVARKRHPIGDDHWTARMPERLARGERHGSRTRPDRVSKGERHWSRRNPELAAERMRQTMAGREPLRGVNHGNAKLTDDIVREMKRLNAEEGIGSKLISRRFNKIVSDSYVRCILRGEAWSHVKLEG